MIIIAKENGKALRYYWNDHFQEKTLLGLKNNSYHIFVLSLCFEYYFKIPNAIFIFIIFT
jgi:hypothetical protein